MVTGAAASIIYGEPKLTNDIDVVMDLGPAEVESFINIFPLENFYCPPSEVILVEIAGILTISPDQIDFKELSEKIGRLMLEKQWSAAKKFKL